MTERYEINGVDLSTVVHSVTAIEGFMGVPRPVQRDITVPGRWGVIDTKPYFGERTVTLGVVLRGSTRDDYLENAKEFMSLVVNNGRPFTLTRVHVTDSGEQRVDARARYSSGLEAMEPISPSSGRASIEIVMLDGFWLSQDYLDTNDVSASLFGVTVPGELSTPFVRVEFSSASAAQRLTNEDTGEWIEWDGDTTTHPVVVDVDAFTVTQNASVALADFTFDNADGERYWFRLGPGENRLTLTGGGTVRVEYKGVFL